MRPRLEDRKHLRELKWKELMSRVDAYRFYIKLILEVNAFFYATTGAVLLFYLNLNQEHHYWEFFLLLPILMGTVVGGFLKYARALQTHNGEIIERIRTKLEGLDMDIEHIPDLKLLNRLLRVFGNLFFIVAAALSCVPLLRSINSWFSLGKCPRLGLIGFTVIGLFIVLVGFVVSTLARRRYIEEHGLKRSTGQ